MFQISEILRKVPFFQNLEKEGIDYIVERLKFKPYEQDETICQSGDPGDKMYIIINGKVKVVVRAEPDGEENLIAYLAAGDYFGEMSLLTGEPRSASVITTEPSEMFILNKSDFDQIIEKFPSITLSMGKIMSQRLRDTLQKAAKKGSGEMSAVKGKLVEKKLDDILKFCESNSLNGRLMVTHGQQTGELYYEKGELQKIVLGDMPEDRALDTMRNWETGDFLIEPRPIKLAEPKAEAAPRKSGESFRVIIVNNSMVVQRLLQRAFDGLGYEVYAVDSAAKAVKMAESMSPHLVISDTKLPDADGVDFAASVRAISKVPVVLLTDGSNKAEHQSRAQNISNLHFTNSQEVGEVVKTVQGVLS